MSYYYLPITLQPGVSMRQGFTLIELMIVIAIIAIIAAIAIPNLLESRITANEAQGASSLKAGIFPGQTQFQAGGYIDVDSDGRGTFANHVAAMAGGIGVGTALNLGPTKALSLLDPKFGNQQGKATHQVVTFTIVTGAAPANASRVGAYDYFMHTDLATEDNSETYFGGTCSPVKTDGSEARRAFGINAAGTIYQTKQTITNGEAADIAVVGVTNGNVLGGKSMFGTLPSSTIATVGSDAAPYQK